MRSKIIAILYSQFLLVGCYTTKLPQSIIPFRLTTLTDAEYRLGYITEEPIIEHIGNKKPASPWFDDYDNYAKFRFYIIEDYRPLGIKELWDNTVYSMLISEGVDSVEIVRIPSAYRDTTVTLFYPINRKSDLKKINRCYKNGSLLMTGSFWESTNIKDSKLFIARLNNFHPSYLDSLTPASIYKRVELN